MMALPVTRGVVTDNASELIALFGVVSTATAVVAAAATATSTASSSFPQDLTA